MIVNLHVSMTAFTYASRVLKETKSLVEGGIVDVVYIAALHEGTLERTQAIDAARRVVRFRLYTRKLPKNLAVQMLKYLEFALRVSMLAVSCKAGIINVHHVGLLPLGVLLRVLTGGRLVYDAHELETEAAGLSGIRKSLAKLVERICIRFADLVVVVSPGIEAWYRSRYRLNNIVTVLNTPAHATVEKTDTLRTALAIPPSNKILLYQGGLSSGRGIERLLDAASCISQRGYALVFLGYGDLQSRIQEAARRVGSVYFHPAVSPDILLHYTASADIGLASIEDVSLSYQLSLPNKLFEYLMAGLPVVVSRLPEMDQFVRENRVGVSVPDWTVESLLKALDAVQVLEGENLAARIARVMREHCWEKQAALLVQAYRLHVKSSMRDA